MKTRRKKKKVKEAARWKSIPWRDVDNPVPCQNTLRFFCLPSSPVSLSILASSPSSSSSSSSISFFSLLLLLFYSSPLSLIYRGSRIIYNVSPFWKRDFRLGYLEPVPGLTWKYCKLVRGSGCFIRSSYRENTVLRSRNLPEIPRSIRWIARIIARFRGNIEIKGGKDRGSIVVGSLRGRMFLKILLRIIVFVNFFFFFCSIEENRDYVHGIYYSTG